MNKQDRPVDLTDRAGFSHWTPVTIRFSDQDPLGHVNNVATAAYVEAGRTMLIHRFMNREKYPDLNFALVRLEMDYLAEFAYPGTVDVGSRLLRIGTKSFSSGFGLFVGERCVATSVSVNVFFDTAKRQGVEPPQAIRDAMVEAIARGGV
jgi:acyl-CoA thioester hydrolase